MQNGSITMKAVQPAENRKVSLNRITVNYDEYGPPMAPGVVFIHEAGLDRTIWQMQHEAVKSNYRSIAPDLRGHGETIAWEEDYSPATMTSDLLGFITALGLHRPILCGQGLGGLIASLAAMQAPDQISGLILCGVGPVKESWGRLISSLKNTGTAAASSEQHLDQLITLLFASRSLYTRKTEARLVRQILSSAKLSAFGSIYESLKDYEDIKIPQGMRSLVITGEEDYLAPLRYATKLKEGSSNAELLVVPFAGHLPQLENTHEFNRALKLFADKVCAEKHLSPHCG
jgi:pimeloyl-ACP methyl ester carboxylesterase